MPGIVHRLLDLVANHARLLIFLLGILSDCDELLHVGISYSAGTFEVPAGVQILLVAMLQTDYSFEKHELPPGDRSGKRIFNHASTLYSPLLTLSFHTHKKVGF